jgi:NAD(P)-dependent dehydrogenase (short-subunit alcohol dehydrogenase family)
MESADACQRAVVQTDITALEDRTRLLDAAPAFYGLVIFTGLATRGAADWEQSLQVNYLGPIQLARERLRGSNAMELRVNHPSGLFFDIATCNSRI